MGHDLPCIFAIAQSNSLTEPVLSSLRQHSRQSCLVAVPSKQTLRTCLILSQPSRLQTAVHALAARRHTYALQKEFTDHTAITQPTRPYTECSAQGFSTKQKHRDSVQNKRNVCYQKNNDRLACKQRRRALSVWCSSSRHASATDSSAAVSKASAAAAAEHRSRATR